MTASISAPVFKPSPSFTSSRPASGASTPVPVAAAQAMPSSSISTEHLKAATFVPRSGSAAGTPGLAPSSTSTIYQPTESSGQAVNEAGGGFTASAAANAPANTTGNDSTHHHHQAPTHEDKQFYPTDTRTLDHHLYATPLPHTSNLPPSHLPLHHFFLPADLLAFVHDRSEAKWETRSADASLPSEVHVYHSLHTLVAGASLPDSASLRLFGYKTDVYRARCRLDARLYCLRRVEGFKLAKETAFSVLDKWRRIRHPNIVSVREAFTTRLFNDASVIFAYDYHPRSRTLYEAHLAPRMEMMTQPNGTIMPVPTSPGPIPERILWSFIAQIANALKAIHTAGLACRVVEPTKIILTAHNRIRLNACSIVDVITHEAPTSGNNSSGGNTNINNNTVYLQQEDLIQFGKLLVSLCCGTTAAAANVHHPNNLAASLESIQATYSPDVKLIIMYLLGKPGPGKGIDDVLVMLGPRLLNEFDAMQK